MSKGSSGTAPTPTSFSNYAILPLSIPAQASYPHPTTHYLYVRASKPSATDLSAEATAQRNREIFISNVPVDATKHVLKQLFNELTGGVGRVEDVVFEGEKKVRTGVTSISEATASLNGALAEGGSRKRKRPGIEELEEIMRSEDGQLPKLWNRELRSSGSSAVVVFVDRTAAAAALKEARRKAKKREEVAWKSEERDAPLGSKSKFPTIIPVWCQIANNY